MVFNENNKIDKTDGIVKKYRYLLTIARRGGVNRVVFRLITADNPDGIEIQLPLDMDGGKVAEYLHDFVRAAGYKKIKIGRYLGSKIKTDEKSKARHFLFSCKLSR